MLKLKCLLVISIFCINKLIVLNGNSIKNELNDPIIDFLMSNQNADYYKNDSSLIGTLNLIIKNLTENLTGENLAYNEEIWNTITVIEIEVYGYYKKATIVTF